MRSGTSRCARKRHARTQRRARRPSVEGRSCYGQQGLWYTGHVGAGAQGSHGSAHGLQGLLQQPTSAPRKPASTAAMTNLRIISLSSVSLPRMRLRVPSSVLAASPANDVRSTCADRLWFADPVPLPVVGPSRRRTAAPAGAARVEATAPGEGDQGDHEHQADQTLHGSNSLHRGPATPRGLGLVSPPFAR